jgi:hypothetical protein
MAMTQLETLIELSHKVIKSKKTLRVKALAVATNNGEDMVSIILGPGVHKVNDTLVVDSLLSFSLTASSTGDIEDLPTTIDCQDNRDFVMFNMHKIGIALISDIEFR